MPPELSEFPASSQDEPSTATTLSPEERWFEEIRPDFVQGRGSEEADRCEAGPESATARSPDWSSERETPDA
jgi:hypothetical protein